MADLATGSPGPDRIVFANGTNGYAYVGTITHTNASTNNGFVLYVQGRKEYYE